MIEHEYNGKIYRWSAWDDGTIWPVGANGRWIGKPHLFKDLKGPRGFRDAYRDWYWKHHGLKENKLSKFLLQSAKDDKRVKEYGDHYLTWRNHSIDTARSLLESGAVLEVVTVA